jgi:hypothetical protein
VRDGLLLYQFAQFLITCAHRTRRQRHRILRNRALREAHARQVFHDGGYFPHWHAMGVMQDMSQRFHSRTDPVRCRSLLSVGYVGVPAANRFSALSAAPRLNFIAAYLGLPLQRNIGDRNNFRSRFPEITAAVRTAPLDTHGDQFGSQTRFRRASKPEEALSRLAPRGLRVRLMRPFRERGRSATPLQLLDLGAQLLYHPMLIQDHLYQLLAAQ